MRRREWLGCDSNDIFTFCTFKIQQNDYISRYGSGEYGCSESWAEMYANYLDGVYEKDVWRFMDVKGMEKFVEEMIDWATRRGTARGWIPGGT